MIIVACLPLSVYSNVFGSAKGINGICFVCFCFPLSQMARLYLSLLRLKCGKGRDVKQCVSFIHALVTWLLYILWVKKIFLVVVVASKMY